MKIFLDSANWEEIDEAASWGILSGVTTNPSLVAKEGNISFPELLKKITHRIEGPVSAEVIGTTAEEMVKEGHELSKIASNIVIKIPMTIEGLKATHQLKDRGIATNVTLIFTPAQALLAARAGASYVSPFVGRLDDQGVNGIGVVANIADTFATHQLPTQIIAASIRNATHFVEAALIGADIATVPFGILKEMTRHPLTDAGLEKFLADWNAKKKFNIKKE